ncbi:phosphate ABC transporter substrate-binding protein [Vibrio sp. 10N.261.46.E12]|uniref:phosphate ABC transporter substrate-binding protein n=1 Tax=unclassified Vibrio TaxID=2614977 RepID=UPI000977AE08|nr:MULTISPECIES: phosphate ABC transporter substrate-binding protein [unclassified Vibrio]OMO38454.1 phosphate ABC transporter substrate-binding protein [Vibrio sp. 10N.261.45.E1]PMJ26720.1 phosphate ABC transporter substrate-binding protein [Vibrio sp. 10N.286.45.B6]PML95845.1 phosphate ABC transporter substrate-binding protein [Vibrio sp. 10N.261.49.E11]PMM72012.1 phosphate ABC transporter substrate-binding protein [Vibrio sp. 10N.261.46.F12]PMM90404.1 phosphate ABC transporter substrate-bin
MKKILTLMAATFISFNASAGMVVIGNSAGVDALSSADVKKLFMGKSNQLGNGSKAQIVELVDGAAGRIAFHEVATGRSESQLQSAWARLVFTGKAEAPVQVADYSAVINHVSSNANAIGYVDESALSGDVKVLFKY